MSGNSRNWITVIRMSPWNMALFPELALCNEGESLKYGAIPGNEGR